MDIHFLGLRWKHGTAPEVAAAAERTFYDAEGVAALLSECDLLRSRAAAVGVELEGSGASLKALDQLPPRWRDDPEELPWFGNDAGLYLGTVIVRTVPGAVWKVWPDGKPVVILPSGRELDVVGAGHAWAETGSPELSQVHDEARGA